MQIDDCREEKNMDFGYLSDGDVFELSGCIYMKIRTNEAFMFSMNIVKEFNPNWRIKKLKAKIIIDD